MSRHLHSDGSIGLIKRKPRLTHAAEVETHASINLSFLHSFILFRLLCAEDSELQKATGPCPSALAQTSKAIGPTLKVTPLIPIKPAASDPIELSLQRGAISVKAVVTEYIMQGARYREPMVIHASALATAQDENVLKELQNRYSHLCNAPL